MLERKIVVVSGDAHLNLRNISRLEVLLNSGFSVERADVFHSNRFEEKVIYILAREYDQETADVKDIANGKIPFLEGDSEDSNSNLIYDTWYCPNCNARYELEYDDYDYCPKCGQKIDWEGIEES